MHGLYYSDTFIKTQKRLKIMCVLIRQSKACARFLSRPLFQSRNRPIIIPIQANDGRNEIKSAYLSAGNQFVTEKTFSC